MNKGQNRRKKGSGSVGHPDARVEVFFKMVKNEELIKKIGLWMRTLGYSEDTIKRENYILKNFFQWLQDKKIELENLSTKNIIDYNEYLHKKPILATTIRTYQSSIKILDNYYQKFYNKKILKTELELETDIKSEKEILTTEEIKKVYEELEESHKGQLDRVILGLYYGCGLRLREGINLKIEDIDFRNNIVEVVKTKGKENRFVPLTNRIRRDIENYIKYTRSIISASSNQVLINFITGKGMKGKTIRKKIKEMMIKTRIEKKITTHNLRHSIATHLIERGMDIEQIAKFLGHKSLRSTQSYTNVWKSMKDI